MKILFIQTGGTIDKDYPKTTNGWGFEIGEPAFLRLLEERLSPSFEYEVRTVCKKDSTEITSSDRSNIAHEISRIRHGKEFDGVVITHGTDTMAETAFGLYCWLAKNFSDRKVPIVFTGSMRPERFSNSDADCNLGMAIAAVQTVPSNFVGICMHGLVLSHDVIDRDPKTGKFFRAEPHLGTHFPGAPRTTGKALPAKIPAAKTPTAAATPAIPPPAAAAAASTAADSAISSASPALAPAAGLRETMDQWETEKKTQKSATSSFRVVATLQKDTEREKEQLMIQLAKKDEELKRLRVTKDAEQKRRREIMDQWETETKTQKSAISKRTVCVKLRSEGTSSKLSRMTVDMTQDLQKKLNLCIVRYIKDKMYSDFKFLRNDLWADVITVEAVENKYLSIPIGWTEQEFAEHMRAEIYKCYARIRHNSQSMARKRFLGKFGYVVNLGLLGYVANLRSLEYAVNLGS
jgi:L-asparaginase